MVLPLIPLAAGAASLAAGALGLKKGLNAKKIFEEAREIGENSQRRYRRSIEELNQKRDSVNYELESLGELKKKIFTDTLGYVVQQLKNARSSVNGISEEITFIEVKEIDIFDRALTEISGLDISTGTAHGLAAGSAGAFGAYGAVGLLASASTGTAISSLSGAAATNATLAWLGGGSLATGGLGIAGGTWVLGGLVAGPALAIAGYTLASKAEDALTKAEEYKAEISVAIAELQTPSLLLDAIQANISDTRFVLEELTRRFFAARLDYERHLKKSKGWRRWVAKILGKHYQSKLNQQREQRLATLVALGKSVKAVVSEPLLDDTGAAMQGFACRIVGAVAVESIEESLKSCVNCKKPINPLFRICPECEAPQDTLPTSATEDEHSDNNSRGRVGRVAAISMAIIVVLGALAGYWYIKILPGRQQILEPVSSAAPAAPVDNKIVIEEKPALIDSVVQLKTLGMTIPYFEKLAGPAKYIEDGNLARTYEIDGCEIKVILGQGEQQRIEGLSVIMSPTCKAKANGFFPDDTRKILLSDLTISKITDLLSSLPDFSADCIKDCGNSYDPSIFVSWTAARHLDFIEVTAGILLVNNASIQASQKWADGMAETEGEEWVTNNQFNCNQGKYQNIANQLFYHIKPTSITFGKSATKPECSK
ncbi:hypothetical protein GTP23_16885 [Pseudoduganella sp. FT93W]|uniref:Uncharacterized protein n=1 Tax=Duganella fentianensis TaxID=2692177 RepID=A0A845I0B3_9BURK|nr:hypothetical protein [Duganella fentianensis]MYN46723.1 hypothetical protein [Duganella fentianensis]